MESACVGQAGREEGKPSTGSQSVDGGRGTGSSSLSLSTPQPHFGARQQLLHIRELSLLIEIRYATTGEQGTKSQMRGAKGGTLEIGG